MYSFYHIMMARALRIAVVQGQYDMRRITASEALECLRLPLTPDDEETIFDDSDQLELRPEDERGT